MCRLWATTCQDESSLGRGALCVCVCLGICSLVCSVFELKMYCLYRCGRSVSDCVSVHGCFSVRVFVVRTVFYVC